MHKTKNDLSCDAVKLDYQALMSVARYALANTANVLITTGSAIRDQLCDDGSTISIYTAAQNLPSTVKQLLIAAETYYTLVEGIEREHKHLVNVPTE